MWVFSTKNCTRWSGTTFTRCMLLVVQVTNIAETLMTRIYFGDN